MKFVRSSMSVVLIFAILLPCALCASAAEMSLPISQSERLAVIDVLTEIEPHKEAWGLEGVDFCDLEIGAPVQTYNYVENTLESGNMMYPLSANDRLILWAVPASGQFQITTGLVNELNSVLNVGTPFALIYDASNIYLYADNTITLLKHTNQDISLRGSLNTNARFAVGEINTVRLSQKTHLGYNVSMQRSTQVNISCNVNYVTQNPYKNLCWAASVACIANYKKGTSLDAATVARNYHGSTNFDRGILPNGLPVILWDYGLDYYVFSDYGSFGDRIMDSILADNPVGGSFDVINGGYHATVIFGINVIAGRLQVMDPEFGMTTATIQSAGNGYSYVSNVYNTTLVLYGISYDTGV